MAKSCNNSHHAQLKDQLELGPLLQLLSVSQFFRLRVPKFPGALFFIMIKLITIHDSHEIVVLEFPISDCSQNELWCHAKQTDVTTPIENTWRRSNQHYKFNALVARIDDHNLVFNHTVWARRQHTGEQLDKLCFSASHLIRFWKMCYITCTRNAYVSYCIFWEIKHLILC